MLSPRAYQLILDHEVGGGAKYYEKALARPSWPGGESGVTIGVGYDLGYNSALEFRNDWAPYISLDWIDRLSRACGAKGSRARGMVAEFREIRIPWLAAEGVFKSVTIPRFVRLTLDAFPGADVLPADAFGALVSLVFNRGSSMAGDRRLEMRQVRAAVAQQDLRAVAGAIRRMKRLWVGKGLDGLLHRRDDEAALVELAMG
jgi:hypothetical protein